MLNKTKRSWILGASDPEMQAIEGLLHECGEHVELAVDMQGARVHPANAYSAMLDLTSYDSGATLYLVECGSLVVLDADAEARSHGDRSWSCIVTIDHHRPCDPGFGRPPAEFLSASSLGQVLSALARIGVRLHDFSLAATGERCTKDGLSYGQWGWVVSALGYTWQIPHTLVLTAAADHCLGAAYRGECPGVNPEQLMHWRAESRAAFQKRRIADVLADIQRAQAAVLTAPRVALDGTPPRRKREARWPNASAMALCVRDMRREKPIPELTEAALRLNEGYISGPLNSPDGRSKITCSGSEEQIRAFIDDWAPSQGLVDTYGDPARGFAGGYLGKREYVK